MVDVNPDSKSFGRLVGQVDMPNTGDELHHFGWNACSASLCPWAPHPHVERRYLVVPGINSSRIHILDTKADPRRPELVKVIEPETVAKKTGYASPHTVHCGPDGIYMSALGAPDGDGPGGLFVLDHDTFEPRRAWEQDRGPQQLAYDFAWHLGHDTTVTSEWGTPDMVRHGVNPELLLGGKYGNSLHVWDLRKGNHRQKLHAGRRIPDDARAPACPRPAQGVRVRRRGDLAEGSLRFGLALVSRISRTAQEWKVKKVIEIPAEPADAAELPPLLQGFEAVPPLITDINLSLDDRQLYVSCWGTGELRQYDVTDPFAAEAHRHGADRRHRASGRPPRAAERRSSTAGRRWSS